MGALLEEYLRTCDYPNNRLLDKLNEEQAEIRRLREIIQGSATE